MILAIEPDFVAWINENLAREGIQVELQGRTNHVLVTTPHWHQHYDLRDNADLGFLMASVLECTRANKLGAEMRAKAEAAA